MYTYTWYIKYYYLLNELTYYLKFYYFSHYYAEIIILYIYRCFFNLPHILIPRVSYLFAWYSMYVEYIHIRYCVRSSCVYDREIYLHYTAPCFHFSMHNIIRCLYAQLYTFDIYSRYIRICVRMYIHISMNVCDSICFILYNRNMFIIYSSTFNF